MNLLRYCACLRQPQCAMKDKCSYHYEDDEGYDFCKRRMMLAAAATIDGLYGIVDKYKSIYGSLTGMKDTVG